VGLTSEQDVPAAVEALTGHRFRDLALLQSALTHASAADGRINSNERLEFLGDSAIGFVVCTALFSARPDLLEGDLTKVKSNVVSGRVLAELAVECGLEAMMRVDKGVRTRQGLPESVLAGAFESLVGALYLDAGLEVTRAFLMPRLAPRIDAALRLGHQQNFKQVLQQCLAQMDMGLPVYTVLDEKGPDHAKAFEICVQAGSRRFPGAWGPSKKQAEQLAALAALRELGLAADAPDGEVQIVWPTKSVPG
jgi:ribonuclease-3